MDSLQTIFELFPYALMGGIIIAAACSLLGVFTILNRMVFVSITLAEASACGVAASFAINLSPFIGAFLFNLLVTSVIIWPFENRRISRETILGIMFVLAASLSILIVSKSAFGLHEVKSLMYGDLILTSSTDFFLICLMLIPVIIIFIIFLRPILYTFLDRDTAKLLGINVRLMEIIYFLSLSVVIAAASKVAGAILTFSLLILPSATGLAASRHFKSVMVFSLLAGVIATIMGLYISLEADLPTNQTISAVACMLFFLIFVLLRLAWNKN